MAAAVTDALEENGFFVRAQVWLAEPKDCSRGSKTNSEAKEQCDRDPYIGLRIWWSTLDWEESLVGYVAPRWASIDIPSTSSSSLK